MSNFQKSRYTVLATSLLLVVGCGGSGGGSGNTASTSSTSDESSTPVPPVTRVASEDENTSIDPVLDISTMETDESGQADNQADAVISGDNVTASVPELETGAESDLSTMNVCVGDACIADDAESVVEDSENDELVVEQPPVFEALNDPITHQTMDPLWPVCVQNEGLGSSNSWQLEADNGRRVLGACVKRCPEDSNFIPDPDFPGLGWDNENMTACVQVSAEYSPNSSAPVPVPLYLPSETPSRAVFNSPFIATLFHGNPVWHCTHQQRVLSSDEFQDTGETLNYVFSADGSLSMQNATGQETGSWKFDRNASTRAIRLQPGPENAQIQSPDGYIGNLMFSDDNKTFTVYQTTVDRLHCSSNLNTSPTIDFPKSIEEVNSSPIVSVTSLENRQLSCDWMQSLYNDFYLGSNIDTGWEPRNGGAVSIQVQSITLNDNAVRPNRYTIEDQGGLSYHLDGNTLSSFNQSVGEVFTNGLGPIEEVQFRSFGEQILMTITNLNYGPQLGNTWVGFYMCR